ncbi:hypothetical protein R3Q06_33305 [Rhodococcus erythropolis]|uniref:hypothetical protein n=1 Tax=Rhodococcus erythropolis TaxID=1833 RepID=UPI00294A8BEF|nr:hypothetical protein [Rhodococcus erythropolis]MDV6278322.1 hypothetical protein [Rhodococcus erythropolis]
MTNHVHAHYPEAFLVEVDGSSSAGPTESVLNVTHWEFVFGNSDSTFGTIIASVDLPRRAVTIKTESGVWVGSTPMPEFPTMSPVDAEKLLRKAGYTQSFKFVTLRQPNVAEPVPYPLFIFGPLDGAGYVGVDTVTDAVVPIH